MLIAEEAATQIGGLLRAQAGRTESGPPSRTADESPSESLISPEMRDQFLLVYNESVADTRTSVDTNPPPDKKTKYNLEYACDWLGAIVTCTAMIPQGFLAALLTDSVIVTLVKSNNDQAQNDDASTVTVLLIRAFSSIIACVASEEGKRILVRSFNTETFKQLSKAKWWSDNFDLRKWKIQDYANAAFTVVASGVFAYIAELACKGMNGLLLDYHTKFTDILADIIMWRAVRGTFIFSADFSNLFGFPFIHKGGVGVLTNGVHYLIENPEFRAIRLQLKAEIRTLRNAWRSAIERGGYVTATYLLNQLFGKTDGPADFSVLSLADKNYILRQLDLNAMSQAKLQEILPYALGLGRQRKQVTLWTEENWITFIPKHLTAATTVLATVIGFGNFFTMAAGAAEMFYLKSFASVFGVMDMISMSLLALSVYYTICSFFEHIFDKDRSINVFLDPKNRYKISSIILEASVLSGIILFIVAGGIPNACQSWIIKQALSIIILSCLASAFVEIGPFLALFLSIFVNSRTAASPETDLGVKGDRILVKLESVIDNAGPDKLMPLRNTHSLENTCLNGDDEEEGERLRLLPNNIPQYRPGYTAAVNNLSQTYSSYLQSASDTYTIFREKASNSSATCRQMVNEFYTRCTPGFFPWRAQVSNNQGGIAPAVVDQHSAPIAARCEA